MIDLAVSEAFTVTNPVPRDDARGAKRGESCLEKIKKIFTNALKSAARHDSGLSLLDNFPHFITFANLCEVFMHIFVTKEIRGLLIYDPKRKCDLWRFFTYALLHNDCIHLALNVIIQSIFAAPLEYEQGHWRTAAVYVGGVLAGSLGASLFDNDSMLVGASGGIYALLISQISHIILNYNTLKYVFYRLWAVLILVLADIFYICYHVSVFDNKGPKIGLAAHFAGALSGLLFGALFFNGTVKWRNSLHMISTITIILLLFLVVLLNLMDASMFGTSLCGQLSPEQKLSIRHREIIDFCGYARDSGVGSDEGSPKIFYTESGWKHDGDKVRHPGMDWEEIRSEDLMVDYKILLSPEESRKYLSLLESEISYYDGDLARVRIFGKWHPIPRQQVAFGDRGLTYRFSGNEIPAKDWTPTILELKALVEEASGFEYNFVLVNRYRDGRNYMGEHRDDEVEIDKNTPIASLSLGASREFLFKHRDTKRKVRTDLPVVKKVLESGSLLMMNPPTNTYWYHSLPKRCSCKSVRVNLTFRRVNIV